VTGEIGRVLKALGLADLECRAKGAPGLGHEQRGGVLVPDTSDGVLGLFRLEQHVFQGIREVELGYEGFPVQRGLIGQHPFPEPGLICAGHGDHSEKNGDCDGLHGFGWR